MKLERKHEILNELETLHKQVDFLESHKTLGLIKEDQYQETGMTIQNRVAELEEECGIDTPLFTSKGIMYEDDAKLFEDYNDQVHKAIEEVLND